MTIDNRIFIIPLAPFVVWWWLRAFAWFMGTEWRVGPDLAVLVFMLGVVFGAGLMAMLFAAETTIGSFHIGRKSAGK